MSTASRNPPLATATASRAHQMTSERIATTLLRAGSLRDRAEAARQLQPHVRQCLLRVGAADTEQCHTSKTRNSHTPGGVTADGTLCTRMREHMHSRALTQASGSHTTGT